MKITIDISDREMLDIDTAISARQAWISQRLSLSAYRGQSENDKKIIEELESLSSILDKLYEALNTGRTPKGS